MATRLKTAQFAFATLASVTNNTLTNFTQITVYLPESTKTIKKAWVEISADDIITATGGTLTTKTVDLRLAAVAYTSTTNSQGLSNSGENMSFFVERDFTSHFTTNWSGTSMTCDVRVQINQSTGTTTGLVNVTCILNITYEYDDSATTQLKTVWIPLNAPVTQLPSSKTSHDTIPALDTYLPEASKTYRNIFIVTQANTTQITTTAHTVSYELSSLGVTTTGNYEAALLSDRWSKYVWEITSYIDTSTTHTFNVWASITQRHHTMQAWLVVTYEFDASATTSVLNSLILPADYSSPFGGTTANDYNRSVTELYVQESGVVLNKLAAYFFWAANANDATINARIGSGLYTGYSNTGSAVICGQKGLMIRNDSPTGIIFNKGKNTLFFDLYSTSTSTRGGGASLFWIVNYTSTGHASGVGAHNHTVIWPIHLNDTSASAQQLITATGAIQIPELNYFISNLGYKMDFMTQGTAVQGVSVGVERTSGEGLYRFEKIYSDSCPNDTEAGLYSIYASSKKLFQLWPGNTGNGQLILESGRRYQLYVASSSVFFNSLYQYVTYHSIPYKVSGNITNSNGGNIRINLHRHSNGEILETTTRSGNGPYQFTWYDNTEPVYVSAYENDSYKGRSASGLAII